MMKRGCGWSGLVTVVLMAGGIAGAEGRRTITVGPAGADFTTIQAAVNAAPEAGAVIRIQPGVYRVVVHVDKPGIQLRGDTIGRNRCVFLNVVEYEALNLISPLLLHC